MLFALFAQLSYVYLIGLKIHSAFLRFSSEDASFRSRTRLQYEVAFWDGRGVLKPESNAGALKRIGHEVLASSDCFETRVLLDCKIVTQVLSAEIDIVDAWFG